MSTRLSSRELSLFRFESLSRVVAVSFVTCLLLLLFSVAAYSQCSLPSFSAAAGPAYHNITLSIGGVNSPATVQFIDGNGIWRDYLYATQNGNYGAGPFGHNQTVNFRAHNAGCNDTQWVPASATTFDVGQPWLNVWPGPGTSVYIQSGAVDPDLNSAVVWSDTGIEPFTFHSSWQRLPENGVDPPQLQALSPNHTYYFYAEIFLGIEVRKTPIKMVRLAGDQDYGACP
jgi:hypothetical protein